LTGVDDHSARLVEQLGGKTHAAIQEECAAE
jgi:hypothetical protein